MMSILQDFISYSQQKCRYYHCYFSVDSTYMEILDMCLFHFLGMEFKQVTKVMLTDSFS